MAISPKSRAPATRLPPKLRSAPPEDLRSWADAITNPQLFAQLATEGMAKAEVRRNRRICAGLARAFRRQATRQLRRAGR